MIKKNKMALIALSVLSLVFSSVIGTLSKAGAIDLPTCSKTVKSECNQVLTVKNTSVDETRATFSGESYLDLDHPTSAWNITGYQYDLYQAGQKVSTGKVENNTSIVQTSLTDNYKQVSDITVDGLTPDTEYTVSLTDLQATNKNDTQFLLSEWASIAAGSIERAYSGQGSIFSVSFKTKAQTPANTNPTVKTVKPSGVKVYKTAKAIKSALKKHKITNKKQLKKLAKKLKGKEVLWQKTSKKTKKFSKKISFTGINFTPSIKYTVSGYASKVKLVKKSGSKLEIKVVKKAKRAKVATIKVKVYDGTKLVKTQAVYLVIW
jgi:hypothetical protein